MEEQTLSMENTEKIKPSEERIWEKYYPEEAKNFDFPKMKTYDLVYEQNKNNKDSIALGYEENDICYGEFFDKVEEKTEYFKSQNVKENDIVTVSMLMTPEFVYDFYALGRLNAITNLIDPRTSVDGIRKYLEEAGSDTILNTDIFTSKIKQAIEQDPIKVINYSLGDSANKMPLGLGAVSGVMGIYSNMIEKKDSRFQKYEPEVSDKKTELPPYMENQGLTIVHTGGTTGVPKGVLLSHDNYNAMAWQYLKSGIGFAPNDSFLLVMPPWISYGSGMLHMSLVRGMKSIIISKLDSKKMANYLIKYKPQWFAGVPAHYKIILESDLIAKKGVPFVKAGAVGGDAMSAELYESVQKYLVDNGAQKGVYPGYALTEATSAFAVKHTDEFKPGSSGIPLPGSTCGVFKFDENTEMTLDEELDYNQTGEICLRTPNQMLGYFKNEELTNQVLRKHADGYTWIHTGDLGHIDEDGFLFLDGRIKEVIIRHDGFKVYPNLIEKVINSHEAVSGCKVVGVPDCIHNQGQFPRSFIVLKEAYRNKEAKVLKEIKERCNTCLPEYYVEHGTYEAIDKLPLTPIGKVDYRTLQKSDEKQKKLSLIKK
jgi:long-chain acyl-CoA synthetase